MNRKGFTLVELIATIALLAIIAIISFVSINTIMKSSKFNNCESIKNNIISAAKEYASDIRYDFNECNSHTTIITAQELINKHYLTSPVQDPFNNDKKIDPTKINIAIGFNDKCSAETISITVNSHQIDCSNESTFSDALIG